MLLSGRADRQSGTKRTGVSLSFSLSLSLFLRFFRSFVSLARSSWRGREREADGGVRAGLLRGETLPPRSVVSDQTAGQCEPSWAVFIYYTHPRLSLLRHEVVISIWKSRSTASEIRFACSFCDDRRPPRSRGNTATKPSEKNLRLASIEIEDA